MHSVTTPVPAVKQVYGMVAEFSTPGELLSVAAKLQEAGYRKFDVHSPFPIHGMDDAMREKRSRISYAAAAASLAGGLGILGLIWWVHTIAYPLIISGKPFFSYQAFFPPIFAICVLSAAFGALLTFLGVMDLRWNHPLFDSETFKKFSDDGFMVSIEAKDSKFDVAKTGELLKTLGAKGVETVMGEV